MATMAPADFAPSTGRSPAAGQCPDGKGNRLHDLPCLILSEYAFGSGNHVLSRRVVPPGAAGLLPKRSQCRRQRGFSW